MIYIKITVKGARIKTAATNGEAVEARAREVGVSLLASPFKSGATCNTSAFCNDGDSYRRALGGSIVFAPDWTAALPWDTRWQHHAHTRLGRLPCRAEFTIMCCY